MYNIPSPNIQLPNIECSNSKKVDITTSYQIVILDKSKFLRDINLLSLNINTDPQLKVTGKFFSLNKKIIYKPERGYARLRHSLYWLAVVICLVILVLGVAWAIFDHKKRKIAGIE